MTPSEWRAHAAGYLAASQTLVRHVGECVEALKERAPPAINEQLAEVETILARLQEWFIDPANRCGD